MADDAKPARDYRETVFLPDTPFPMRAGLPQMEPRILEGWADLYGEVRRARQAANAPLFVLHDGPPYANGAIHIGHALNKTLKDFVVRSRFAMGYDVDYVPGWDCHGLPIEWKIEEEFRSKGRRKDDVPTAEFRTRCREYAAGWIAEQMGEFKRMGVIGDWTRRYSTMDFTSEAAIVAEFHKFIATQQVYRGSKPVMWSPVERTALAEAEIEYHPHNSPTVWVKFPVVKGPGALMGAAVVIWTTTPWTIPANRAVSYNPKIDYAVYQVTAMEPDLGFEPWAKPGDRLVLADKLAEDVRANAKVAAWTRLGPADMAGVILSHPLAALAPAADEKAGYGFEVPMLAGDHVTEEAGTGFVHTAPSHGADDYNVWIATGHSRDSIPDMVDEDGVYYPHVPLFGGLAVLETEGKKAGRFGPANPAVTEKLIEAGMLLARGRVEHDYPHSWRSKAPVIFRNTPQWFVRMDTPLADGRTLRETALQAIDDTAFYPPMGKNRLRGMLETRPDWLLSRQRAWGAPMAMFVEKTTGIPLNDEEVNARIVRLIGEEGADAWFTRPASDFLGNAHDPEQFEKVEDILDVWFDSGSTHAFVIEGRDDSRWPADLYLEGSDQHRGWFQSSLLESCATRGRAPYGEVVTHGFTMAEDGRKMSKSLGNSIEPQDVIKESGAEIIRLWSALVDYQEDQNIGRTILQTTIDAYRKLRNTVRYLLGGLAGFSEAERLPVGEMPPLERFILHRLRELDGQVRDAYRTYAFQDVLRALQDFCTLDLSAGYFDIRRDVLYCDRPDSLRRRACRTVMDLVFERLTLWLSPLIPFTTEEAWTTRFPEAGSNSLRVFPDTPAAWADPAEAGRWSTVRELVGAVTGALELLRQRKVIGSALEANVSLEVELPHLKAVFDQLDVAEVFRTSQGRVVVVDRFTTSSPDDDFHTFTIPLDRIGHVVNVVVEMAAKTGRKCARSWRVLPEVGSDPRYPDLSLRDADAVAWWDAQHGR